MDLEKAIVCIVRAHPLNLKISFQMILLQLLHKQIYFIFCKGRNLNSTQMLIADIKNCLLAGWRIVCDIFSSKLSEAINHNHVTA